MTMEKFESQRDSLGIVATSDLDSDIRLTKYTSLFQEQAQHQVIDIQNGVVPEKSGDQLFYRGKTPIKSLDCNEIEQLVRDLEQENEFQKSQQVSNNEFKVIWRSLSFDVGANLYDRLMNAAFDGLHSLSTLGGCLKSREEPSPGALDNKVASTCALTKNQQLATFKQSADSLPKRSKTHTGKRNVFKNLNGFIKSGEITAILGPSGAGKTSLLSAICGGGNLENYGGQIEVLGGGSKRHMQLSIIPQKDYLIENLTVRENLLYSSQLLNVNKNFDHSANIMRVVKMLNLLNCLDSPASNISGGEYKRVSIAQELLRQPDILILDEPTSGLDSLNCKMLIKNLKNLIEASKEGTMNPIAVVMTIHQPDIEVFNMFDHVYCMARKGRVIFDGHPSQVMQTIKSQAGFSSATGEAPPGVFEDTHMLNPANLLIEIASDDLYGQDPIERLARLQKKQFEVFYYNWINCLSSSNQLKSSGESPRPVLESVLSIEDGKSSTKSLKRDKRLKPKHEHDGKFWYHTKLLTRRAFVSALRDPLMTIVALMFHLLVPITMWIVYPLKVGQTKACPVIQRELDMVSMISNQTMDKMKDQQADMLLAFECSCMLFVTAYALSMCSVCIAALAFPLNMHILLKEVRNGWYNQKTFVLAKQLASFPFEVIFPACSIMLIYILLDMPDSDYNWRLWSMAIVMSITAMISSTNGLIIGALCMDSVQSAVFLAIGSTLPTMMLSGFTVRLKWLPKIFQHMSWFSFYRYTSELMNVIRFGFGICPCDEATDLYLRNNKPQFTDVPSNLKHTFVYYLTSLEEEKEDSLDNGTMVNPFPNIMTLNKTERSSLVAKLDSDEVDILEQMAESMTRSLSYGHKISSCDDVESELIASFEAKTEERIVLTVCCMIGLLVFFKIILSLVVKYKVGTKT